MDSAVVNLDDDGTWECQHVAHSGHAAPPTRLRMDRALELDPGFPTSAPRRWITCPDCGTYWRVWVNLRIAKPSMEWFAAGATSVPRRCRRAPVRDIDRVIDLVKAELREIFVAQHQPVWPADDDGVWFFQLPNVEYGIQLESSTGMCPFLVEHDGMSSPGDGWNAASAEEAAGMIVGYLRPEVAASAGAVGG